MALSLGLLGVRWPSVWVCWGQDDSQSGSVGGRMTLSLGCVRGRITLILGLWG